MRCFRRQSDLKAGTAVQGNGVRYHLYCRTTYYVQRGVGRRLPHMFCRHCILCLSRTSEHGTTTPSPELATSIVAIIQSTLHRRRYILVIHPLVTLQSHISHLRSHLMVFLVRCNVRKHVARERARHSPTVTGSLGNRTEPWRALDAWFPGRSS